MAECRLQDLVTHMDIAGDSNGAPGRDTTAQESGAASSCASGAPAPSALPSLIALIDTQERYLYSNDAFTIWYQIEPRTMRGQRTVDVIPAELYRTVQPLLQRALAGERIESEREVMVEGRLRHARATYTPHSDAQGHVLSVSIMVADITDTYEMQSRLARSEAQFQSAFQHAAIGMALVDPAGRWMRLNDSLCAMLGYREDELLGKPASELLHADDRLLGGREMAETLAHQRHAFTLERRYIRRDARAVHVRENISLILDPIGRPLHFLLQIEDVSERKAAEEALFREHEFARVTLDAIVDAVITTDLSGRINYLNPAAEQLLCLPRHAARGRPLEQMFVLNDPASHAPIDNPLHLALASNQPAPADAEIRLICPNGRQALVKLSAAPIHATDGKVIGGVLIVRDISEYHALAMRITHYVRHDPLTGLPNRTELVQGISTAMAEREGDQPLALLLLDIDRFKQINDSLGHRAGDEILRRIGHSLRAALGEEAIVGRMGGDEFAILLRRHQSVAEVSATTERLLRDHARTQLFDDQEVPVSLTIGISLYPNDCRDAEQMLRNAAIAAESAKMQRGNSYRFFAQAMNDETGRRFRIEQGLRRALAGNQFFLHYQPKIELASGRIVGTEALIRWRDADGRLLPPDSFIPIAEENGLIIPIGQWVLEAACRQQAAWREEGLPLVPVSVNVSALQLRHPDFFDMLARTLSDTALPGDALDLELTEATVMAEGGEVVSIMARIKALGVTLSIDDFGTGYSNLSYLKRFPIDTLKVDRSLIHDVPDDPDDAAIAQAIIALGRVIGVHVIAEGIETEAQASFLRSIGCDQGQGYLFSRPVEAAECARLLRAQAEKSVALTLDCALPRGT